MTVRSRHSTGPGTRRLLAGIPLLLLAIALLPSQPLAQQSGDGARRSDLPGFGGLQTRDPDAPQTPEEQRTIEQFDDQRRADNPGGSHIPTDLVGPVPPADPDSGDGLFSNLNPGNGPGASLPVASPLDKQAPGAIAPMPDLRQALERQYAITAVAREPSRAPAPTPATGTPSATSPPADPVVVAAGGHAYATAIAGTDSRFKMPVLVRIHSGPLAGGVLTGTFALAGRVLGLTFTHLELGGQERAIDAWAVSPDCICAAIEGEVDHHWIERVILPAAAAFASGWMRSAAAPERTVSIEGTTIITQETPRERAPIRQGAAQAIDTVAGALGQTAPAGPTISLAAGTDMLIIFTRAVRGRFTTGAAPPRLERHAGGFGGARW